MPGITGTSSQFSRTFGWGSKGVGRRCSPNLQVGKYKVSTVSKARARGPGGREGPESKEAFPGGVNVQRQRVNKGGGGVSGMQPRGGGGGKNLIKVTIGNKRH